MDKRRSPLVCSTSLLGNTLKGTCTELERLLLEGNSRRRIEGDLLEVRMDGRWRHGWLGGISAPASELWVDTGGLKPFHCILDVPWVYFQIHLVCGLSCRCYRLCAHSDVEEAKYGFAGEL